MPSGGFNTDKKDQYGSTVLPTEALKEHTKDNHDDYRNVKDTRFQVCCLYLLDLLFRKNRNF